MAIIYDDTPVQLRSADLAPVLWQGRQWAVTEAGLERRDGTYFIDAKRLTETWDSGEPAWLAHMGEKTWLDHDDFSTAFLVALTLHNNSDFGREMIDRGLKLLNKCRRMSR